MKKDGEWIVRDAWKMLGLASISISKVNCGHLCTQTPAVGCQHPGSAQLRWRETTLSFIVLQWMSCRDRWGVPQLRASSAAQWNGSNLLAPATFQNFYPLTSTSPPSPSQLTSDSGLARGLHRARVICSKSNLVQICSKKKVSPCQQHWHFRPDNSSPTVTNQTSPDIPRAGKYTPTLHPSGDPLS